MNNHKQLNDGVSTMQHAQPDRRLVEERVIQLLQMAGDLAYEKLTSGECSQEQLREMTTSLCNIQSGFERLLMLLDQQTERQGG